jgi:hypothetical protein
MTFLPRVSLLMKASAGHAWIAQRLTADVIWGRKVLLRSSSSLCQIASRGALPSKCFESRSSTAVAARSSLSSIPWVPVRKNRCWCRCRACSRSTNAP